MKSKNSFSTRLSLNILLLTSILFILAIGIVAFSSHKLIAEEATKSAENLLDATINEIEMSLQKVEFAVEASSWLVQEEKDNENYLYHITEEIVIENENIVGSAIAFIPGYHNGEHFFSPYSYNDPKTGNVHSKQLGSEEYNYFEMEWFKDPYQTGESGWCEPYYDDGGGEYLMSTYSFPIKDEHGNVFAVITADITLDWLNSIISKIKPYKRSFVSLMSRSGNYINTAAEYDKIGNNVYSTLDSISGNTRNISNLVSEMMSGKKGMMQYTVGNNISFAVFGPLKNGWIASISCDYRDVLERSSRMQMILIIVGLFGLLMLFLACYYAVRKLTKPLSDVSDSALKIAEGNFNTKLPEIKSEDEIKQLCDSFDYMQQSLTTYVSELKKTTAQNERFESELNIASKIQMAMVPANFPEMGNIDLYAILKPAKEVGGDLYDFFIKDNCLYFAIGDVSGKGVPASLFMAITRSAFRFICGLGLPMNQVLSQINDALCDGNNIGMFVTMFIGKLDLATGEMTYCNGGHNPVIVNGKFLDMKSNIACGVMDGFSYVEQRTTLEKGSSIVLYTDGVTEAEKADKSQYGEDRLLAGAGERYGNCSARKLCEGLLEDVRTFTNGNEQNDDITIMCIKYN